MKSTITVRISFIILLLLVLNVSNNTNSKKLQIGIKKRPKNCTIKSKKGDLLHVFYQGSFPSGEKFDSNFNGKLFTFTLGSEQVIKGWDQGLIGMCIGEQRKLLIPPHLGYGTRGAPPKITPNQPLIFSVELVNIERKNPK
ncbi:peptidyl-prolyl cis-trans isomerase FKBP2 [Agrilus planipennis]|uniref:peptidylprolyl isomerase n=1 Tax=Agrilus planipennis TaxID=224129 RepID=A0A1W4XR94_AGRPL|nr:peptidyl-prolyl cis-trans isomerase FKBP2 [Agrilus planipennis]